MHLRMKLQAPGASVEKKEQLNNKLQDVVTTAAAALQHGADPKAKYAVENFFHDREDVFGRTLLNQVSFFALPEFVELLLPRCDPDEVDDRFKRSSISWVVLTHPSDADCVETMEALVNGGANLDHADLHGLTAVHLAAQNVRTELMAVLLSNGANPNALSRDERPRTPLDCILGSCFDDTLRRNHCVRVMVLNGAWFFTVQPGSDRLKAKLLLLTWVVQNLFFKKALYDHRNIIESIIKFIPIKLTRGEYEFEEDYDRRWMMR
jgi:hypothetical protein